MAARVLEESHAPEFDTRPRARVRCHLRVQMVARDIFTYTKTLFLLTRACAKCFWNIKMHPRNQVQEHLEKSQETQFFYLNFFRPLTPESGHINRFFFSPQENVAKSNLKITIKIVVSKSSLTFVKVNIFIYIFEFSGRWKKYRNKFSNNLGSGWPSAW